jgi:putative transposase
VSGEDGFALVGGTSDFVAKLEDDAQRFNRRHRRAGHLFQGRFKAIVVDREGQLLGRSLPAAEPGSGGHLLPGGGVAVEQLPGDDRTRTGPVPLACDELLRPFATGRANAQARLRAFIEDGLGDRPLAALDGSVLLGRDEFVRAHADPLVAEPEIPRQQWQPQRPSLDELFGTEGELALATAYCKYGYRMREIASHLDVHYATVSRRLRALEQRGV